MQFRAWILDRLLCFVFLYTAAVDTVPTTGTATITVTVTDNKAPVFDQPSYTKCIANGSPADTSVITVSATDPDAGDTLTYSIHSNGNTDFKIDSAGVIKVNSGKTLNMATTPAYTLVVKAVDSNINHLTGSTTVSIQVTDRNCSGSGNGGGSGNVSGNGNGSGSATVAASILTVLLTLFVTL